MDEEKQRKTISRPNYWLEKLAPMDDKRIDDILDGVRELQDEMKQVRSELVELRVWNRIFKIGVSAVGAVALTVIAAYVQWKING